VDLGIAGRTAYIADDALRAALEPVFGHEGVRVTGELTNEVDIVISRADPRPQRQLLDVASAEELHEAWSAVVGTIATYRTVLPSMVERGWGRLVWVGSAAAKSLNADTDETGAVLSLAVMAAHKVISAEAGASGITANAVLFGGTATSDDLAAAVAFVCSEGAAYLTGVTLSVDGGVGAAVY
jgi:3-oxoacyl-[acyl-carrier protein] reductase